MEIHGDVRYAGTVNGACKWKAGYIRIVWNATENMWQCSIHNESKNEIPALKFRISHKNIQKIPKNPIIAENSGFVLLEFKATYSLWFKRNEHTVKGSIFNFIRLLTEIRDKKSDFCSDSSVTSKQIDKIEIQDVNKDSLYASNEISNDLMPDNIVRKVDYSRSFSKLGYKKDNFARDRKSLSPVKTPKSPGYLVQNVTQSERRNRNVRRSIRLVPDSTRNLVSDSSPDLVEKENRGPVIQTEQNPGKVKRLLNFYRNSETKPQKMSNDDFRDSNSSEPVARLSDTIGTSKFYYKTQSDNVTTIRNNIFHSPEKTTESPKRSPLSEIRTPLKRQKIISEYDEDMDYSSTSGPSELKCEKQTSSVSGFTNIGNSCYMNSVLQALFALDCFVHDLLLTGRDCENLPEKTLFKSLVKLALAKMGGSATEQHLESVKDAVCAAAPWFAGMDQHDAHEFLGQVLDQLKEEFAKLSESTNSVRNENFRDSVSTNFEFEMINSYQCDGCSGTTLKKESFLMLSLNMPSLPNNGIGTLQDSLDSYFLPEKLEFCCEKCQNRNAHCIRTLAYLPRVLVLHLKRYNYSNHSMKLVQPVFIPTYLTLQEHIDCSTQTPLYFQSNSSLCHTEDSLFRDYYEDTSDSKTSSQEEEWTGSNLPTKNEIWNNGIRPVSVIGLKGGKADISEDTTTECENKNVTSNTEVSVEQCEDTEQNIQAQEENELQIALAKSIEDCTMASEQSSEESSSDENFYVVRTEEDEEALKENFLRGHLPFSYQLLAVVSHVGSTSQSGHYLCDVYDRCTDSWWHCNDDVVHKTEHRDILNERASSAYLFFYVSKDTLQEVPIR